MARRQRRDSGAARHGTRQRFVGRQRAKALLTGAVSTALVFGGNLTPVSAQSATRPAVPHTFRSALTPAQIQALSGNADQKVIILLANQHPEAPTPRSGRAAKLAADQQPILTELDDLHAGRVHGYSFVNAVSATISKAEEARLETDPAVSAVVPDGETRYGASPAVAPVGSSANGITSHTDANSTVASGRPVAPTGATASRPATGYPSAGGTPAQACSADPNKPVLEPEALQSMNVDNGPGGAPAAHSLADGAGVKVAVFPDGLDPNIRDFLTNGGKGPSAIFDYEDFTGEGPNAVTGGAEAFGDASSIISQGNRVFNLQGEVNPTYPLEPCYIKVEGVAPAASLAVMKVFGATNFAFNSEILQAIDYAVNVDHVDVLSESFGGNPVPNPGTDPIAVADQDAVNAGISVVVSSGDAGGTNTIGSPAVDPGVIAAGASTDYRLYQQTTSYGIQFGGNGWESDQISGLSSSGVTEANRTVDVLAPGEANWADCSSNTAVYLECADAYNGTDPQPIFAFGGTSEAAPLTAGTAALVIQSYRDTHGGATPSPAVVKQILMSTSRDLFSKASDQGAGLIDAYRAVLAARSYGAAANQGDALLYSPNAINSIGAAGTRTTTPLTVTNDGGASQTVSPTVRALGPPSTLASGSLELDQATDPTFIWQTGGAVGDEHILTFNVPPGTDRLHTAIAWDQKATAVFQTIRFDLFDPQGRLAIQSRPQGPVGFPAGGYSQAEVHTPQPGTWTLLVFDTSFSGTNSYTGPLTYTITGQRFETIPAAVRPATATIAPGRSATFEVTTTTPRAPGDSSESVVFGNDPSGVARATVPVTLRSMARVGRPFGGTLTGGNARMAFYGQELPYQFEVKGHHADISADVSVSAPGYQVLAFLVDPSGTPVDVQSSASWDGSGTNGQTISLFRQNPTPGRWSLLVVQINNVDSLLTSATFDAFIRYDGVIASASHLPNGGVLRTSKPRTATIEVKNTGSQPEAYMVDARRSQQSLMSLTALGASPSSQPLPISNGGDIPQFVLPPFSPFAAIGAQSTVPITLDTSPNFGTPDVEGLSQGTSSVAVLHAAELPASLYSCAPSEQGPFNGTAPSTTFSCGGAALTNPFAPDVTTSTGNLWADLEQGTNTYNPLVLAPGQSGTITVKLVPTDPTGTDVSGFLTLETFNFNTFSSDEVATFPYRYTVKS